MKGQKTAAFAALGTALVQRAPLGDQDARTVRLLRFGVGVIGLLLPIALPFGNWVFVQFGHQTRILPRSMSASYYTSTRNIFVGALCALGVFLICYRYNARDDKWSTVAGISAIGVALCPTAPQDPTPYQSAVGEAHLVLAGILLTALAMFCLWSFRDPAAAQRDRTDHAYLAAGASILAFLGVAVVTGVLHWGDRWTPTPLYVCESLSVWAFGLAWTGAAFEIGARRPGRPPHPVPRAGALQL
ncbi:DUF998 domain-containing protein [Actinocrinis puniceicyclus]|uniref:DUF998 domain-containing protein n=1 Tax=Actinocrinis puniceicyclus TaxID=977794 RepID=A0A8J7WUI5_9ACTN|nr:hypothetical protein [Actinocrinis puniceicyclus]MBS2966702.1 DUF998 domain-containing protein [Actinocrinis puniceicyclus]